MMYTLHVLFVKIHPTLFNQWQRKNFTRNQAVGKQSLTATKTTVLHYFSLVYTSVVKSHYL